MAFFAKGYEINFRIKGHTKGNADPMPRLETRWWEPDPTRGEHHPAARGFRYDAYVPDPVVGLALPLPLDLAADLEAAAIAAARWPCAPRSTTSRPRACSAWFR